MKVFLVLDDSPVIRKVANRILTDLGFAVAEASSALQAIEYCRYKVPHAMLVDWSLPDMSGLEFIEEFRKFENAGETRILYYTCELMVAEMARARRAGAHCFMMKPFNREILSHKVKELVLEQSEQDAA